MNDGEFEAVGERLASAGDRVALEYGWWAGEWIRREAERAGEPGHDGYPDSRADPNSRAAFSYALNMLEKRHGRFLSHGQIADRIRVGRAFPKEDYDGLVEELRYTFTFSQLRAAFERDNPSKTMENILWARDNDATPLEIYAHKMGGAAETDEQKAWRHLVEWAFKYTNRGGGCNQPRDRLAREILEHDRQEREQVECLVLENDYN